MTKERYYWYKQHKICVVCGQEDAAKGLTKCPTCEDKAKISANTYRNRNRETQNTKARIAMQKLRNERKKQGLCIYCGKRKAINATECVYCRAKRRKKQRKKVYEYGM